MQEISYKNLVPGTKYYIQHPPKIFYHPRDGKQKGNGKQKGIFVEKSNNNKSVQHWSLIFKTVRDISKKNKSGYDYVDRDDECIHHWFDSNTTKFYLPATKELKLKIKLEEINAKIQATNQWLQQITGDPYFMFYEK